MLESLDQKLSRVEYEELSSQVYDYEEEKNLHIGNRDMIDMERENLQVQAEQTEKKLHIFQCARQQDSVSEEKEELNLLREKSQLPDSRELIWNRREKPHWPDLEKHFSKNVFRITDNSRKTCLKIIQKREKKHRMRRKDPKNWKKDP